MSRLARATMAALPVLAVPAVALAQTYDNAPGDAAAAGLLGAFFSIFGTLWILMACVLPMLMVALMVLWVFALIDAASRNEWEYPSALEGHPSSNDKVVWVLVVVLAGVVGAIVYFFVVMRKYPLKEVRACLAAEAAQQPPAPATLVQQPPAPAPAAPAEPQAPPPAETPSPTGDGSQDEKPAG